MSLFGDSLTLLRDLKMLGLAVDAQYYDSDGTGPVSVIAAIDYTQNIHDMEVQGEVNRRAATITIAREQVEDPDYDGFIRVASGPWAGDWYIFERIPDDNGWQLECMTDYGVSARSAAARNLSGGG